VKTRSEDGLSPQGKSTYLGIRKSFANVFGTKYAKYMGFFTFTTGFLQILAIEILNIFIFKISVANILRIFAKVPSEKSKSPYISHICHRKHSQKICN